MPISNKEIEGRAVEFVCSYERANGRVPHDVRTKRTGYDVESGGRKIEVKGIPVTQYSTRDGATESGRLDRGAGEAEAAILRDEWQARGLSPEVLRKVSFDVFSIKLPDQE